MVGGRHLSGRLLRNTRRWASGSSGGSGIDREALVDAALSRVHELGWSHEAIVAGAKDLDLSPAAHGLLPGGATELVHTFLERCHKQTSESIRSDYENFMGKPLADRLCTGLKIRLNQFSPYKSTWHQAVGLQALPRNVKKSLNISVNMADEIWFLAGDRSADESWYAKRGGLVTAMNVSELAWIRDESKDQQATRELIQRCIDVALRGSDQLTDVMIRAHAFAHLTVNTASSIFRSMRHGY
eukprot:Plantae.Rhodophyta-Purpureofilum_apyrenoidigerum.ctg44763.p1 GENE.Plantae.Rhodophyta-Purpureofilum_apyrenoidigerum.ctg44763~~Plantae.Rhodophyta-Purpureofilum_apyrenoidigerum.ctg44763.p1  ORF type:complete len:242 (-),score=17.01 Plantae.Rhodophyta-Purpureofilum_apyrenoidigerum.ctg44763:122-847(-)